MFERGKNETFFFLSAIRRTSHNIVYHQKNALTGRSRRRRRLRNHRVIRHCTARAVTTCRYRVKYHVHYDMFVCRCGKIFNKAACTRLYNTTRNGQILQPHDFSWYDIAPMRHRVRWRETVFFSTPKQTRSLDQRSYQTMIIRQRHLRKIVCFRWPGVQISLISGYHNASVLI